MLKPLVLTVQILALGCASSMAVAAERPEAGFEQCQSKGLVRLKSQIVDYDYRGELDQLDKAAGRAGNFADEANCQGPAAYWQGFAHWRYATNAANDPAVPKARIAERLDRSAIALRTAIAATPNDPEPKIALMGVVQMRPMFEQQGSDSWRGAIIESQRLLAELEQISPRNPRFLWLRGGLHFWAPRPVGLGPDAALEAYRKGLDAMDPASGLQGSLTPDWGKPELLMSIGYVAANRPNPDLLLAEIHVRAALQLRPDWHYARDILLPDILKRRAVSGA
jgi:hypothetical protein